MLTEHQRVVSGPGEIIERRLCLVDRPVRNLSLNVLTGQRVDSHVTDTDRRRRHLSVIPRDHRTVGEEEKRHRHNVRLARFIQHDNVKLPGTVEHGKSPFGRHNPARNRLRAGGHKVPGLGSQRFNIPSIPAANSRRNLCPALQFLHKSTVLPHAFRQSKPGAIHSECHSLTPQRRGKFLGLFLLIRHAGGEIRLKAGIQKLPVPGLNCVFRPRS